MTTINVQFRVHTVVLGSAPVQTTVDGEEVTANVQSLDVELVPVNSRSGSMTLRVIGQNIQQAKSMFTQDALISAAFTKQG